MFKCMYGPCLYNPTAYMGSDYALHCLWESAPHLLYLHMFRALSTSRSF